MTVKQLRNSIPRSFRLQTSVLTWLSFFACGSTILIAVAWLTAKALQLDRTEAYAQRQADQEEVVGSVLWQMDSELSRMLSIEVARSPSDFQAIQRFGGKGKEVTTTASPLLMDDSPFVLLHFEIGTDGQWTSPQCPDDQQLKSIPRIQELTNRIRTSRDRLAQLSDRLDYGDLLPRLPEPSILSGAPWKIAQSQPDSQVSQIGPQKIVNNVFDDEQVEELISQQAEAMPQFAQQRTLPTIAHSLARQQRSESRRRLDLQQRGQLLQNSAQNAFHENRRKNSAGPPASETLVREGISQVVWMNAQLLLARQVQAGAAVKIQGCWLDWPKIKTHLIQHAGPILSDVDLEPIEDISRARLSRVLGTLPVQLVVSEAEPAMILWSPIRISLYVAWFFLIATIGAIGILLHGVLVLSDRRAAFVSAVTHELRTPLTTFRMYSEMLADGMVTQPEQRQTYFTTLRDEADRLSHLVENVLQYARLERGAPTHRRELISIGSLLDRIENRLAMRASQADMTFEVETTAEVRQIELRTDPTAVEQILFNLVDNACKYANRAADRRIQLQIQTHLSSVEFRVRDHGSGIAKCDVKRTFRPFSKSAKDTAESAPGVGLGLALCRRLARDLAGELRLEENGGNGAVFLLRVPMS